MSSFPTRPFWRIAGSLAAVVALSFGTVQAVSAVARDRSTETYSFDAANIDALLVDTESGDVTVAGHEGDVTVDTGSGDDDIRESIGIMPYLLGSGMHMDLRICRVLELLGNQKSIRIFPVDLLCLS